MKPLLETINTRFGTANKHAFSRGNTLPYTGVPFGMNYFVPQTSDQEGAWFFDSHLPIFQGIRLTHQPSPWIGDYSWLLLTPVTGQLGGDSLFHRQSSYDIDKACFQPHYLKLFSLRYQIESQLTPTCYGASIRLEQKQGKALALYLHAADELTVEQVDKRTLALRQEGKTETNKSPLILFTALQMNTDILAVSQESGDWRIDLANSHAEIQLGTSFISPSQALINLPQEDFDSCKENAQANWENLLHRFDVIETGEADRTFFDHCLYRLFLFPQTFYEVNESGQAIHMDLSTGTVKSGILFSNNGFWDTFRTTFPLFALIIPEHYHRFLEGFLNSYRDTGFLPKWLKPILWACIPALLVIAVVYVLQKNYNLSLLFFVLFLIPCFAPWYYRRKLKELYNSSKLLQEKRSIFLFESGFSVTNLYLAYSDIPPAHRKTELNTIYTHTIPYENLYTIDDSKEKYYLFISINSGYAVKKSDCSPNAQAFLSNLKAAVNSGKKRKK